MRSGAVRSGEGSGGGGNPRRDQSEKHEPHTVMRGKINGLGWKNLSTTPWVFPCHGCFIGFSGEAVRMPFVPWPPSAGDITEQTW